MFLLPIFSEAQDYKPFEKEKLFDIMPSVSRFVVNLSGKWEYSLDESEWFYTNLPNSEITAKKVFYRRTIKIDKNLNQKYSWQLYFLGIDDQVEVYINDQFVGKYLGGLTPFNVSIPNRLMFNETNTIKLIVTSAVDAARKIKDQYIFAKKNYTGVIRDLLLVGTSKIWVSDVKYKFQLKPDYSSVNIKTKVKISSASITNYVAHTAIQDSLSALGLSKTTVGVEISIKNKQNGQIVAQNTPQIIEIEPERTIPIEFNMTINTPMIWSVEFPNLYEITVKITKNGQTIDDYTINSGFQSIVTRTINGTPQLIINGKPFEFKGVDYIEDYWKTGQTLSASRMEQDIIWLKTLGANVVRVKYNSPHPYFLHLCEKYGLYAMVELPVYDVPNSLLSLDEITVRMKNFADRYYVAFENNPAVLAWGVSDGVIEGSKASIDFSKAIVDLFKAASSKLIYKIVLFGSKIINTDGFDFVGISDNKKFNSSDEIKNELYRMKGLAKNLPVFVNYGIPIQPTNHNGYSDPLSLESQAYYILNLYHIIKEKQFAGSIITAFNDYELNNPLMIVNNDNANLCTVGLLDRGRQQRLSFQTLQALFNGEKEPLLNAGSYSERTPVTFIVIGLVLLLIIIFLTNRFKRFREYVFRAALRPYNFYADIRDQRIISSVQTVLLGLVISITLGVYTSSILFYYRASETAQLFLSLLVPLSYFRELMFKLIWMPEVLVIVISVLFFGFIFLLAFIIKLFSFFVRGKIFYTDTMMITIWSGIPLIILLPFSIVLIRLLVMSPIFIWLVVLGLILLWVWVLMRILRSTTVVFDILPVKVYSIGLGVVGTLLIIMISAYQYQFSIFSYIGYLLSSI